MYSNYNDELMNDLRDFEEYIKEQRQKEESEKNKNETKKY